MKKLVFIVVLAVATQLNAQDQLPWLTNHDTALKLAKAEQKPLLVYVTNGVKTPASALLNDQIFNTDTFKKLQSKVILLQLEVPSMEHANYRLGIHYTKKTTTPGLGLVDADGDTIGEPLADITPESAKSFLLFLKSKL
ncbi:MAG: hypothetical protein GYB32_11990 [Algicola sp.]|nr:hypothetical protein [Algicola sp.]